MQKTLAEIAHIVQGEVCGDKKAVISGINGIEEAQAGDITFVSNPKYFPLVETTKASAILAPRSLKIPDRNVVYTDRPSLAFDQILSIFAEPDQFYIKGIHKTASIASSAKLGNNVAVGPFSVIEDGVVIGENSTIHAGSFIGPNSSLGKDCTLYPHVTIREKTVIGDRVVIHSGTVIGADGFGYEQIDGRHKKLSQIGNVVIEDDVEIGANVTIDRARFDKTFIGRGTKIDNLVMIAHNVKIGENCIIISQVGISGSTVVERNCILAGQVGLAGHLKIGEGSIIAAKSGVMRSIPPGSRIFGYPAVDDKEAKKSIVIYQNLPKYVEKIRELERKIEELESKLDK
jgi:UDP-3-O-[3-hydroxymyristoyl] glucosamine N-acyltransferase